MAVVFTFVLCQALCSDKKGEFPVFPRKNLIAYESLGRRLVREVQTRWANLIIYCSQIQLPSNDSTGKVSRSNPISSNTFLKGSLASFSSISLRAVTIRVCLIAHNLEKGRNLTCTSAFTKTRLQTFFPNSRSNK